MAAAEPFWRSPPLQLLALASAATAAIVAGVERFQIPLAPVAISLFVLSAVYALIALGATAAKDFDPIAEGHRRAAMRRAQRGKTLEPPGGWLILVPLLLILLAAAATLYGGALHPPTAETEDARAARVAIVLSIVVVGAGLWLFVLICTNSKAVAPVVDCATAFSFALALLALATPFVSYAARELPRAGEQVAAGVNEKSPPNPDYRGRGGGSSEGGDVHVDVGLNEAQFARLIDAIQGLGGAEGVLTPAQFDALLRALAEGRDGDAGSALTDDQVRILARAIRESPAAQVHVSDGDVEISTTTTTTNTTTTTERSADPLWIRVRHPCTIRRARAPSH